MLFKCLLKWSKVQTDTNVSWMNSIKHWHYHVSLRPLQLHNLYKLIKNHQKVAYLCEKVTTYSLEVSIARYISSCISSPLAIRNHHRRFFIPLLCRAFNKWLINDITTSSLSLFELVRFLSVTLPTRRLFN